MQVAEIVAVGVTSHKSDSPDFTKTSQDGYTFDTWWEAQCLARDIISGHTQVGREGCMTAAVETWVWLAAMACYGV